MRGWECSERTESSIHGAPQNKKTKNGPDRTRGLVTGFPSSSAANPFTAQKQQEGGFGFPLGMRATHRLPRLRRRAPRPRIARRTPPTSAASRCQHAVARAPLGPPSGGGAGEAGAREPERAAEAPLPPRRRGWARCSPRERGAVPACPLPPGSHVPPAPSLPSARAVICGTAAGGSEVPGHPRSSPHMGVKTGRRERDPAWEGAGCFSSAFISLPLCRHLPMLQKINK